MLFRSLVFIASLLSLTAFASPSSAQTLPLPSLTGVILRVVVTEDPSDATVVQFTYQVDNTSGSIPVVSLEIDVSSDASREIVDLTGLTNGAGVDGSSSMVEAALSPDGFTGVRFSSVPAEWRAGLTPAATMQWDAFSAGETVPGTTTSGFVVVSRGLPTVRAAKLEADLFDFLPTAGELQNFTNVRADIDAAAQTVTTIGPTGHPKVLDLSKFAGTIGEYRSVASTQGWISDPAVDAELSTRLTDLRSVLAAKDLRAAKRIGLRLMGIVNQNSCKQIACDGASALTSEAYALLYFNLSYLVESFAPSNPNPNARVLESNR